MALVVSMMQVMRRWKKRRGRKCNHLQCDQLTKIFVCILLGISPASDYGLPTFRNTLSVPSSKNTDKIQNTAKVWNHDHKDLLMPL